MLNTFFYCLTSFFLMIGKFSVALSTFFLLLEFGLLSTGKFLIQPKIMSDQNRVPKDSYICLRKKKIGKLSTCEDIKDS